MSSKATYSLSKIKTLIKSGNFHITRTATITALHDFTFVEDDIVKTVLSLTEANFFKTMPSTDRPGLWHDVYKLYNSGVYLKLQIVSDKAEKAVIISFKEL